MHQVLIFSFVVVCFCVAPIPSRRPTAVTRVPPWVWLLLLTSCGLNT
jgi:hypothetical protein